MELKEGMYVRTKHYIGLPSYIDKIIEITEDYVKFEKPKYTLYAFKHDDIIKASYNIIDLIEVGDYVNGYCVEEKQDNFLIIDSKYNWCWGEGVMPIEEKKSIVTKEEFESMKYDIGE